MLERGAEGEAGGWRASLQARAEIGRRRGDRRKEGRQGCLYKEVMRYLCGAAPWVGLTLRVVQQLDPNRPPARGGARASEHRSGASRRTGCPLAGSGPVRAGPPVFAPAWGVRPWGRRPGEGLFPAPAPRE